MTKKEIKKRIKELKYELNAQSQYNKYVSHGLKDTMRAWALENEIQRLEELLRGE